MVAPGLHGRGRVVAAGFALPHQHRVDRLLFGSSCVHGFICFFFVVQQCTAAVVAVHCYQHAAAGVGGALAACLAAEARKHHRMNNSQARTGQHGDRQLRRHGQVNGDAVAGFEVRKILQQRRGLIDAHPQLLVRDGLVRLILRLRHKQQRHFVAVERQVPVHTVVAGIDASAHKPLKAGRIAAVQRGVPLLVPVQQVRIFFKTFREVIQAEALKDGAVRQVGLRHKRSAGRQQVFLLPVHGNLGFANAAGVFVAHDV